eukprot:824226-Pyramimonas_sp.AAC.1
MRKEVIGRKVEEKLDTEQSDTNPWERLKGVVLEVGEEVLGRGKQSNIAGAPYTQEDARTLEQLKSTMQSSWRRVLECKRTEEEVIARKQHQLDKRKWEHFKRRARSRY